MQSQHDLDRKYLANYADFSALRDFELRFVGNERTFGTITGRTIWPPHDPNKNLPQTTNNKIFKAYVCKGDCQNGLRGRPMIWVRLTPSSFIRCNQISEPAYTELSTDCFYSRLNECVIATSIDMRHFVEVNVEAWDHEKPIIRNWTRLRVVDCHSVHQTLCTAFDPIAPSYPDYIIQRARYPVEPWNDEELQSNTN